MTVNEPLLRATMDAVLANPELHNQSYYAVKTDCGTAGCFAFWACSISDEQVSWGSCTNPVWGSSSFWTVGGRTIPDAAQDLLGIDYETRRVLFSEDNDTATLKHYVDQLCDTGRIVPSDPWTEGQS